MSLARAATDNVTTAAGTGAPGYNGDAIPASTAQLATPVAVAPLPDGGYLITDQGNSRVRRVSPDGVITTVAGNGTNSFGGDGGQATDAQISIPNGVAATADGGFLIADSNNHRVRRVAPDGTITTAAGTGGFGYNGDNQPAAQALLNFPAGVAARPDGSFLIADNDNNRIRQVAADGTITTVAGDGTRSFGGDNGPATSAQLNDPSGVDLTPDGGFLIADKDNNVIRKVDAGGTITSVAGPGGAQLGDGGPATSASLSAPIGVASLADGGFLIAELNGHRVRRVLPDGTITTVAGTGIPGFSGDDGPAGGAQLNTPVGVAVTTGNDFLIADTGNQRIRIVDAGDPPPPPEVGPPVLGSSVNVAVVRGTVLVAVPSALAARSRSRAAQKGLTFVPLTDERQIPVGSFLDTRRGTVALESATPRGNTTQTGRFSSGLFQVRQSSRRSTKGLTDLRLKGGSFRGCRAKAGTASRARASLSRRRIRRLRANAQGRFRTSGRNSSATVRGTIWTVTDRCDGTLTTVKRGRVVVRDLRLKRNVTVRAGKRYLAKARRR